MIDVGISSLEFAYISILIFHTLLCGCLMVMYAIVQGSTSLYLFLDACSIYLHLYIL